ncbi:MAG: alpha/beta hydrolase, partial [Bdellovibrionales bacterium]|nr:alpha/beta hydrolase [Bdellovibrionales bacterium]
GLNGLSWLPFILPSIRKATFYAIDLPGHGCSYEVEPQSKAGFLVDYAECIGRLVEILSGKPYKLVGFSIGAYASLKFISDKISLLPQKYLHIDHTPFPQTTQGWNGQMQSEILNLFDQLQRLVVENNSDVANCGFSDLPDNIKNKYFETIEALNDFSITNKFLGSALRRLYQLPLLGHRLHERVAWPWGLNIIESYHSGKFDLRPCLRDIRVPTLLLVGQNNELFSPEGMKYMNQEMPSSRLVNFDTNHDIPLAAPFKLIKIMSNFIAREEL